MGGGGGGCAGGEEGMWAVGVVGTLLWVVNAVKAQNQTQQEGAPPNADPGGSADTSTVPKQYGALSRVDGCCAHEMLPTFY